jgi:transposase-like protein
MEDYPRTIHDFEERFATEEACRAYVAQLRWPGGFRCPICGREVAWQTGRGLFRCKACDRKTSVTAGTIFQDSHLPLRVWFRAMWWVTSQKTGGSALGLQRVLGLGSYRSAWLLLQKLRRAMVRPGRERLQGRVEVDETYVGGPEEGLRGRKIEKKALVVIAAEEDETRIGRVRMQRVTRASQAELHQFIVESIQPGSVVHTDAWPSYEGLESKGYGHDVTELKSAEPGMEVLPRVHRVASLLKRWLMGTHQGAVSKEHLDYYLDEFTFRFNRRTSRHRGKLFYRLVQNAVAVAPAPYHGIVRHARGRRPKPQDMG